MKKIISSVLVASLFATMTSQMVFASNLSKNIDISYNDIKIILDSKKLLMADANGDIVEPFVSDGTTYLPLRAIAQALSMSVAWDGDTNTITLKSNVQQDKITVSEKTPTIANHNVKVTYRDIKVVLDGRSLDLKDANGKAVEPFIMDGTTYLPLRALSEAMDIDVNWDNSTKTITLSSNIVPGEQPPYDIEANSDWSVTKAEEYGYELDFETKSDDNYVVLTGYTGDETNVLVPSKISGKTVYINNGQLFRDNKTIKYVTFENDLVLYNSSNLFSGCNEIRAIYNMKPVIGISNTFSNCTKLSYLDIDLSTCSTFNRAFSNCKSLKQIFDIPSQVSVIGSAYRGCNVSGDIYCYANNITDPENIQDIFSDTTEDIRFHVFAPSSTYELLKNVNLGSNVTLIKETYEIAYLPKEIDVAVSTTYNIYNYAVSPQYKDCKFTWDCDIGKEYGDKYTITPGENDVGEHPITLSIYKDNDLIYSKDSVVNVVSAKNINKTYNIVTIGDTCAKDPDWRIRINALCSKITFKGTVAGKHEGRIGANTNYYFTNFVYKEDPDVTTLKNPFLNPQTKEFDWSYYIKELNVKPSCVQLMFQSLGGLSIEENISNLKKMIDNIKEAAPETKIFITLPLYINGYSDYTINKLTSYIKELDNEFSEKDDIYLIPLNITYNNTNKVRGVMLPNSEGYLQMGDCMLGVYIASMNK